MVVRVSNGLFLEVLEESPVVGVPIEFDVYDGASPTTMLATLENATGKAFVDVLRDLGSGKFRLAKADPKATTAIIQKGNLVKVKIAGVYRFAWWMDDINDVVLSREEGGGEGYQVSGRGAMAYLERANVYPPGWPAYTATAWAYTATPLAVILRDQVDRAVARTALPAMTYADWTVTADSQGEPWVDTATLEVAAGTYVLDMAMQYMALGIDIVMEHDLRLRAFVDYARHFESTVIFRAGYHLPGDVTKAIRGHAERSRLLVEGANGKFIEVPRSDLEADPYVGRREGYLSFPNSADPTTLQRAGEAALEGLNADTDAISLPVLHSLTDPGQFEPYRDFRKGDWITIDIPGAYDLASYRVMAMTFEDVPGGDYALTIDLNSVNLEALLRLKRAVDAMGGSVSGSSISGSTGSIGGGSVGGSAGGGSGNGKVSVTLGDAKGYLQDKIEVAGSGIAMSLSGAPGDQKVLLTGSSLANPMTTPGDLIVGGAAGVPTRLAKGADDQVLAIDPVTHLIYWRTLPAGIALGATVTTETTFGQASSAGASAAASKADHTHGTPTNPVTAHTAAADPHPGYATDGDVSSLAAAAAAADSAHAAAADPHTGYQRESERNVASGYAGLDSGGHVAQAQLGTGSGGAGTKYLADDQTYKTPAGGVTLGSATPIVESGSGSAGSAAAASHEDHVHPAAAGGGSSRPYLDQTALHGTYGDDFAGASLDAKWTRHNITSGAEAYQQGDGSWLEVTLPTALTDYGYFQPAPAGDFEIQFTQELYSASTHMYGPMIISSTGAGVGLCPYDNSNTIFMANLSGYQYSSSGGNDNLLTLAYQRGEILWLAINKVGTVYTFRWSRNGVLWTPYSTGVTNGFTVDRIGWGRYYGTGAHRIRAGRFNVV